MNFIRQCIKTEFSGDNARYNFLIEHTPTTALEFSLIPHVSDIDLNAIIVSRGYGCHLTESTDIFYIFTEEVMELLRSRKCVMFIDNAVEGHSEFEFPIIRSLYHNCQKYKIDADLIFLIDGNFRSEPVNTALLNLLKLPKSINIISVNGCEQFVIQHNPIDYFTMRTKSFQAKSDKIMLSLSRRGRPYRNLAQYLIHNSFINDVTILSQDQVHSGLVTTTQQDDYDKEIDYSMLENWLDKLPLKADNTDFFYNYAGDLNSELYEKTIFTMVLETHQNMNGDTSLFYSEKCFKPMRCFQPFIIFGQYGCNFGLTEFGYKPYDKYFNLYEIDYEPNPVKRLLLIKIELEKTILKLQSMSRKEQLDWRFKHLDVLLYNQKKLHERTYFNKKMIQVAKTIKSIISNDTKFYWKKV